MVINKKISKIYTFFVLQIAFFLLKLFVSSIISSHAITELSVILSKYYHFLKDFRYNLFRIYDVFCARINVYHDSTFDLNNISTIKFTFDFL